MYLDYSNNSQSKAPTQAEFEQWMTPALAKHPHAELCLRIVGEEEMTQLNLNHRGKNSSTNVLSFPADIAPEVGIQWLGDMAICAEVIEREATQQKKTLDMHYAHMSIHGALHLLGFDHQEPQQAEKMEALESSLMAKLGFANPYTEQKN